VLPAAGSAVPTRFRRPTLAPVRRSGKNLPSRALRYMTAGGRNRSASV
jgi:hypothetical protein